MSSKYYWLKLNKGFFKRHDLMILENENKEYAYFYLKLLVESIDHDGRLRYNDLIPYDDKMLSTITNTPIDTVRVAIEVLQKMNLIEILEDGTIFMNKIQDMLGSETEWAEKKRIYRAEKKKLEAIEDKTNNSVEAVDDWIFIAQEIWEKTFAEYPKKYAEEKARVEWERQVCLTSDVEHRKELARNIYKAIRFYVADYKENYPDDTGFKYVPRFDRWLVDQLSVWEKKMMEGK